jgi:hypothetical protein
VPAQHFLVLKFVWIPCVLRPHPGLDIAIFTNKHAHVVMRFAACAVKLPLPCSNHDLVLGLDKLH